MHPEGKSAPHGGRELIFIGRGKGAVLNLGGLGGICMTSKTRS